MKKPNLILAAIGFGLTVALAGCGQQESGGAAKTPADSAQKAPAATGAEATADGRAIEITGNDTMKFSVTEIRATPGERLSVTLVNIGTMPKFSMGHNWVLLTKEADVNKFVAESATAPTTDYIPPSQASAIIAQTKLLGPKESDTVTFNAPTAPGRYVFLCSFPGHFQVGMKGELIVE